jgi:hypothetical protein
MAEEGGVGSLAIDRGSFTAAKGEVEAGGRIKEEPEGKEKQNKAGVGSEFRRVCVSQYDEC